MFFETIKLLEIHQTEIIDLKSITSKNYRQSENLSLTIRNKPFFKLFCYSHPYLIKIYPKLSNEISILKIYLKIMCNASSIARRDFLSESVAQAEVSLNCLKSNAYKNDSF